MNAPAEIYTDLRARAFGIEPAEVGLAPTPQLQKVFGLLMDLGYPEGTATVVGLSDGTTSLYTSSGGGVIGGGDHPAVAETTLRWLEIAEDVVDALDSTEDAPLPDAGQVAFTVLGYGGRFRAVEEESTLEEGSSPLTPLFVAGHDVITELRRVEELSEAGSR